MTSRTPEGSGLLRSDKRMKSRVWEPAHLLVNIDTIIMLYSANITKFEGKQTRRICIRPTTGSFICAVGT